MKLPKGYVPGVGVPKHEGGFGGFGQKMLERMGWQKGQGLGRTKSGMKDAIEVKKKEDALGVGATESGWKWDRKYWEEAYNSGLQTVGGGGDANSSGSSGTPSSSGEESDDDTSSSSSSSSSDSDSDGAPGLAALMACAVPVNRDGTVATGSSHELKIAAKLAKGSSRVAAGRLSGRDGKLARIRAHEAAAAAAAAAKLGLPAPPVAKSEGGDGDAGGKAAKRKADGGDGKKQDKKQKKGKATSSQQQDDSKEQQQQEQQQQQQPTKGRVITVTLKGLQDAPPTAPFTPTPATGWWGAAMFVSAGRLEGMDEEDDADANGDADGGKSQNKQQQQQQDQPPSGSGRRARATFDEDVQAALYNRLQAAQRQGKRGMGKSSAVKIAGGNWAGSKVTFDEAGGDGDGGGGGEPGSSKKEKKKEKKRRSASAAGDGDTAAAAAAASAAAEEPRTTSSGGGGTRVKWAKLAVAELQRAPKRRMRWRALWAALLQQHQGAGGGGGDVDGTGSAKDAKREAWERISSSSKLRVEGKKRVCLA